MTCTHNYGKFVLKTSVREQAMSLKALFLGMRGLNALVFGMGMLIVAGVTIILGTIVNRSLAPTTTGEVRWLLPQGAEVRDWRIAGDEFVIRLEQDGATLFWTFDRRSGQRRGAVRLEPGPNP
ncbi:MAG: hypothetical protein OXF26_03955 [Alphaproteobacteria bacterium]|nr:hypothetical protein [Alphaproteobacteria bacterium]